MESGPDNQLSVLSEENVDTIILTLPSQLQVEDQPSNSSLVRSDCGQFYLVTYDDTNKVVSKHQINLQINADDFLELKCSSGSGTNDDLGLTRPIIELDSLVDGIVSSLPEQVDDTSQSGIWFIINFQWN